jgi:hypothetical protein
MMRYLSKEARVPALVLALALATHLLMLFHDFATTSVFLNADRAITRWETLRGFMDTLANGRVNAFLTTHGVAGDYALHAVLFGLGGKLGLILTQVGLTLLSGWGVYRIGRLMRLSARLSGVATGVYLFLPHSLVFPHQLSSEALHTPLLIISLWMTAEYLNDTGKVSGSRYLVMGALLVGVAALVRPVTLLWPLVVGLVLMRGMNVRSGAVYIVLAYLPVLIWMGFMGSQTGKFGLGESSHDMGHNLYQRVTRISATMPAGPAQKVRETYLYQGEKGTLGAVTYLHFATEYPVAFTRHAVRDMLVFVGKSGVERISIDYLELNKDARTQMQGGQTGWRQRLEKEGAIAAVRYLWQSQGQVLVISLLGSALMLSMSALAVLGAWSLVSSGGSRGKERYLAWLLIALPLYILVFSQLVNAMQSRHRAPAEAAIVLLAVLGAAYVAGRFSGRVKNRVST